MTLFALAALVVLFVVTWLTIPTSPPAEIAYPARLFALDLAKTQYGHCIKFAGQPDCQQFEVLRRNAIRNGEEEAVQRRVRFIFGGAAVVIVLVGLAFGAGRRKSPSALE